MAFYQITYNEKYRFASLRNYGCTFRCPVCSYKLHSGDTGQPGLAYPEPQKFLTTEEIKHKLSRLNIERVHFIGGEPTIAPDMPEILDFAKNSLRVYTYLGHTNGSKLPMPNLDGADVGLKAWDERIHLKYTGCEKKLIFDNFKAAYDARMQLKANVVYIPGFVDIDQIEPIAAWLAELSCEIPLRIIGYIPVPGQPFPRPTAEQMADAVETSRKYLTNITSSHLDSEQALKLPFRDDRYAVRRIA